MQPSLYVYVFTSNNFEDVFYRFCNKIGFRESDYHA